MKGAAAVVKDLLAEGEGLALVQDWVSDWPLLLDSMLIS